MESFPKELAGTELQRTGESRRTLLEEHSASFKWLMASLLAINSGGMFLLGDVEFSNMVWKLVATGSFYLGILASLAIAWLGQRYNRRGIEPLAKLESFWALVASTGEFDRPTFDELLADVQAATKVGMSRIAGWLAVVAFSVGIISIALGSEFDDGSPMVANIPQEQLHLEPSEE